MGAHGPRARGARRAALGSLAISGALALAAACGEPTVERRREAPVPEGAEVSEWPSEGVVATAPALSDEAPPMLAEAGEIPIERAAAPDVASDSSETVSARRVVYRVHMGVPALVGEPIVDLAVPAAELYVDVSIDRLRARFVGTGWPVHEGAEVRMRGDSPGTYVFDGNGGRSLEPGALATWFEGGPPRPGPRAYVRRDTAADDVTEPQPGPLVCALVAEWASTSRSSLAGRCGNAAPIAFRVGAYRAERTAEVPMELPRSALRSDEREPPEPARYETHRALLEPAALGRLRAEVRRGDDRDVERSEAEEAGLVFENHSDARVVVIVDGVPAGFVDSLDEITLRGLSPAVHEVGAVRPLGGVVMRARLVEVPGRTVLRAAPPPRE